MRKLHRMIASVLVLGAVVIFAACGGDGGKSASTSTTNRLDVLKKTIVPCAYARGLQEGRPPIDDANVGKLIGLMAGAQVFPQNLTASLNASIGNPAAEATTVGNFVAAYC